VAPVAVANAAGRSSRGMLLHVPGPNGSGTATIRELQITGVRSEVSGNGHGAGRCQGRCGGDRAARVRRK
jgi:hypothetical protein